MQKKRNNSWRVTSDRSRNLSFVIGGRKVCTDAMSWWEDGELVFDDLYFLSET